MLCFATLLMSVDLTAGQVVAQDDEPFLTRPQATYRGRIVDAATDRPIPGAVVVIVWDFVAPEDGDRRNAWALRELLSDASGDFSIDALPIETALPPRAYAPRLLIYKPGYSSVPTEPGFPPGAPARPMLGTSKPIRLRPVQTEEERTEAFNAFALNVRGLRFNTTAGSLARSYRMIDEEMERFIRQHERPAGSGEPR